MEPTYTERLRSMRRSYNSGVLITEKEWNTVAKVLSLFDDIQEKTDFIKSTALFEQYLVNDVDSFIIVSQAYNTMFHLLMDLEDYLNFNNEEESVIQTDEEAREILQKAFNKLEKIKEDHKAYFDEEL